MHYTVMEQERLTLLLKATMPTPSRVEQPRYTCPKPAKLLTPKTLDDIQVIRFFMEAQNYTMDRNQRLQLVQMIKETDILAVSARRLGHYLKEAELWLTLSLTCMNHGKFKKAIEYLRSKWKCCR